MSERLTYRCDACQERPALFRLSIQMMESDSDWRWPGTARLGPSLTQPISDFCGRCLATVMFDERAQIRWGPLVAAERMVPHG